MQQVPKKPKVNGHNGEKWQLDMCIIIKNDFKNLIIREYSIS